MTAQTKKWVRFWAVFAFWLVGDLWSKHWADVSLGTTRHPLPVVITEAEAQKPLGQILTDRFGFTETELPGVLLRMQKLQPAANWAATDKPFAADSPAGRARSLWVFWREDQTLPPRRFDLSDGSLTREWLALAHPEKAPAAVKALEIEALSAITFGDWFHEVYRKLDADDVPALFAEKRIYPMAPAEAAMTPQSPVKVGETYLVLERQIDVMGDWFKFTYAENPGAAFGFLKGLSADLRYWVFFLLTLVAFIVIGSIVSKLPAQSWFVLTCFAGILAGAAGNFIDRLRYNYVIDFIDMDLGFMHWPTYNIADVAIAVSVVLLLIDLTFNKQSVLAQKKPAVAGQPSQADKADKTDKTDLAKRPDSSRAKTKG